MLTPEPTEPTTRYRSKVHFYGHFVWATRGRYPHLTIEYERSIHRCIVSEAEQLRCIVLAIGGMPDHVHVVVRIPGTLSPAQLMKQVKGVSSALMNDLRPEFSELFRWQDGYAFFSIGQSEEEQQAIIAYVRNQKKHHASNSLQTEWEAIL